jgi:hypothetical protein
MKNNFDIKTFLIENKVTRNSKIVNEDFTLGDEDMELAKNFDIKYLKVGDIVTPDIDVPDIAPSARINDVVVPPEFTPSKTFVTLSAVPAPFLTLNGPNEELVVIEKQK